MKFGTILDLILCAIILFCAIKYTFKGFATAVIQLCGGIASFFTAYFVSRHFAPKLFTWLIEARLVENVQNYISSTAGAVQTNDLVTKILEFLPKTIVEDFMRSTQNTIDLKAPDVAKQIVEQLIMPIVVPLITIVMFFVVFALVGFIIKLISKAMENANNVPVLGLVNRMFGGVAGVAIGLIYCVIILAGVSAFVYITNGATVSAEAAQGSMFYKFFSAFSPFK